MLRNWILIFALVLLISEVAVSGRKRSKNKRNKAKRQQTQGAANQPVTLGSLFGDFDPISPPMGYSPPPNTKRSRRKSKKSNMPKVPTGLTENIKKGREGKHGDHKIRPRKSKKIQGDQSQPGNGVEVHTKFYPGATCVYKKRYAFDRTGERHMSEEEWQQVQKNRKHPGEIKRCFCKAKDCRNVKVVAVY